MSKFFIGVSILLAFMSCDGSVKGSKNDTATNQPKQEKELSYKYSSWTLKADKSLALLLPQWENEPIKDVSYTYQPQLEGLTIDATSGALKFKSLAKLLNAKVRSITVTATDAENKSKDVQVALKLAAKNKEEIVQLITISDFIPNGDYNYIDVSQVQDMSALFKNDTFKNFNGDISDWDTSNVVNMESMFHDAVEFNQDISRWNTSKVQTMDAMFNGATKFNQDISNWNTANVTTMRFMFNKASAFNQKIGKWNTAKVQKMNGMFNYATKFNQDLNLWDVSKVSDMRSMFALTESFNGNISSWNVKNVVDMANFLAYTTAFNQDISNWEVSKTADIENMFLDATAFNSKYASDNKTAVDPQQYFKIFKVK